MKESDLITFQKTCDELIDNTIARYSATKDLSGYNYTVDPKDIFDRQRLKVSVIKFCQDYLTFLNMKPKYNKKTGRFSVSVNLLDCVFNRKQANRFAIS